MTDKHRQDESTAEEILRLMKKCGMKFFPGCKNLINEMNSYKYVPLNSCPHKTTQIFNGVAGQYCSDCGRWV